MVLAKESEISVYYKETSESRRVSRFCLKPVQTVQPRSEKRSDAVNVLVSKGKAATAVQLDEDEANKVRQHGDHALKKLQKIHKSVVWNLLVGRTAVERISKGKQGSEEVNLDHDENLEFDPGNPKTWSEDSLEFVESLLRAAQFRFDGFVVLFCLANDLKDSAVDYDELAWELEKCLTYHYVSAKSEVIMNEEACMSRKGLDPVSRKSKTPGRKKAGYCVFIAYQLFESVTTDQIVGESINRFTDVHLKKKQMLASLAETKLLPQNDEKVRKAIKETKEYMSRDQIKLVHKIRELGDPENVDMLQQFLTLLKEGRGSGAGLMGLPQFLNFLNKDSKSSSSPRAAPRSSTLPRPTGGPPSVAGRKPSISSQTFSVVSSRSTTPDTPRRNSEMIPSNGNSRAHHRRESSLASIKSSGSASSTPETLRKEEHRASLVPKRKSGVSSANTTPRGTSSANTTPRGTTNASGASARRINSATGGRPSATSRTSRNGPPSQPPAAEPRSSRHHQVRTDSGSRLSSARSSVNGDSPSLGRRGGRLSGQSTPNSSAANSPLMSTSAGSRRSSRGGATVPPGKMITREDLRRMNKSYPSPSSASKKKTKPTPSSFSRTSIPMS